MCHSFIDRKEVRKEYAILKEKIRKLEKDSIERSYLRPYFITKKEISERLCYEKIRQRCFESLNAKAGDAWLIRVLERSIFIDFSIVSFKKIFMADKAFEFSRLLLDHDAEIFGYGKEEIPDLSDAKIQFVYADEESGELRYLIGVYQKLDLKKEDCIQRGRYLLQDYGKEEMERCRKGDGVLAEYMGDRIVQCKIDHLEGYGTIELPDEKDMSRYLNNEDYLVLAQICECDIEKERIMIELSVYPDPLNASY
jgi:hypothetical protein